MEVIGFRLDTRSGIPPYLQIVQQVKHALRLGMLEPGDQLPTVKQVVAEVAINPNTVFKAYRELEREGLVEGRPGLGTFVLKRPAGPPPHMHDALRRSLQRWLKSALDAGLDHESVAALFDSTIRDVLAAEEEEIA
jgi:GntR family transcriptional regulator